MRVKAVKENEKTECVMVCFTFVKSPYSLDLKGALGVFEVALDYWWVHHLNINNE